MKVWIASLILAVFGSSAFAASSNCMDVTNDYVLAGDTEAVLIRLTQKKCASIDYSIMLIKGNRYVPWFTYTFKVGAGFKENPTANDSQYELLVGASSVQLTTKSTVDPQNCVNVMRVEFTNDFNLSGESVTTCDKQAPKVSPLLLLRLG